MCVQLHGEIEIRLGTALIYGHHMYTDKVSYLLNGRKMSRVRHATVIWEQVCGDVP